MFFTSLEKLLVCLAEAYFGGNGGLGISMTWAGQTTSPRLGHLPDKTEPSPVLTHVA